jgi:hypothetical protein
MMLFIVLVGLIPDSFLYSSNSRIMLPPKLQFPCKRGREVIGRTSSRWQLVLGWIDPQYIFQQILWLCGCGSLLFFGPATLARGRWWRRYEAGPSWGPCRRPLIVIFRRRGGVHPRLFLGTLFGAIRVRFVGVVLTLRWRFDWW